MKLSFLLITLFFYTTEITQTNFKLEKSQLIWQKVYEIPNGESLALLLTDKNEMNGTITGKFTGKIDPAKQGISKMKLPIYMHGEFSASVTVENKPDRYRVTVTNIQFEEYSLYDYMTNRHGELNKISQSHLPIIDKHLTFVFTANEKSTDW